MLTKPLDQFMTNALPGARTTGMLPNEDNWDRAEKFDDSKGKVIDVILKHGDFKVLPEI